MTIDLAAVATVALIHLAGVVSPGPNFVAVVHRAVTAPRAEALAVALGIATVAIGFALAAMFGVGLLMTTFPALAYGLKLAGALYLAWFGLRLWRRADMPLPERGAESPHERGDALRGWRDGALTNLANMKSIAFFASVFAAAIPVGVSLGTMAAMVAAVFCNALFWYGAVAWLLSTERAARAYRRAKRFIDRACGALMLLFSARLVLFR